MRAAVTATGIRRNHATPYSACGWCASNRACARAVRGALVWWTTGGPIPAHAAARGAVTVPAPQMAPLAIAMRTTRLRLVTAVQCAAESRSGAAGGTIRDARGLRWWLCPNGHMTGHKRKARSAPHAFGTSVLQIENEADDAVPVTFNSIFQRALATAEKGLAPIAGATHYYVGEPKCLQICVDTVTGRARRKRQID